MLSLLVVAIFLFFMNLSTTRKKKSDINSLETVRSRTERTLWLLMQWRLFFQSWRNNSSKKKIFHNESIFDKMRMREREIACDKYHLQLPEIVSREKEERRQGLKTSVVISLTTWEGKSRYNASVSVVENRAIFIQSYTLFVNEKYPTFSLN